MRAGIKEKLNEIELFFNKTWKDEPIEKMGLYLSTVGRIMIKLIKERVNELDEEFEIIVEEYNKCIKDMHSFGNQIEMGKYFAKLGKITAKLISIYDELKN